MKMTRRDLLVWGAGATAGLIVTPVPWKLLDDVSIWTQNWRWIPQPARAPVEVQRSYCTLCSHGCPLRVRMAEGWPVGLAGVAQHPLTHGALCPLGFGAHQLIWHPQRLRAVRHREGASSWKEAQAAFAKACGEGPVLIIDGQPGRAASAIFQEFAKRHGGFYRAIPSPEVQALAPYAAWTGVLAGAMGYDLENARTIVSFGAPMLDGWGTPGRFTRLWAECAAGSRDPQMRLIQVEASLSRTAARAWKWVPIPAGAEAALASGLARVLVEEHLVAARGPLPPMELDEAAHQTGLSAAALRELARTMVERLPALVVAADADPTVAALNVLLGSVGARGGIVCRTKSLAPKVAAEPLGKDVRAVLIDATVPWDFAPQTDGEVFRFAAWDGGANHADWLLPAPGFLEDLTDVPTPPGSAIDLYAIAPSLVKTPVEVRSLAQFLAGADSTLATVDKIIHARCQELYRRRVGTLNGQEAIPIAKMESAEKLEEELGKGAVWVGEAAPADHLGCELKEWPAALPARAEVRPSAWPAPVFPPLASKLYQESNLRGASERGTT